MDPIVVRLKLVIYRKVLDGLLQILKETFKRVANNEPKEYILETIKKDFRGLIRNVDEYEERLISS